MLPDIRVSLSDTDHKGIESLQPVEITLTGEVVRTGEVIGLESTTGDEG
jgi:hypothetical protein